MLLRLVFVISLLALTACSSKLAYNNLDWLAYWFIADDVELNEPQSTLLESQLSELLDWHRQVELPKYQSRLMQLREQILADKVQAIDWSELMAFIQQRWLALRDRSTDLAMEQIPSLSEVQILELFLALDESNQERLEEVERDEDKRFEQRYEQLEKTARGLLGSINEEQALLLELFLGASVDTRLLYAESMVTMRSQLKLDLLDYQQSPSSQKLGAIKQTMLEPERFQSNLLLGYRQENRIQGAELLTSLALTLTQQQKQHLVDELNDWIELIDELTEGEV